MIYLYNDSYFCLFLYCNIIILGFLAWFLAKIAEITWAYLKNVTKVHFSHSPTSYLKIKKSKLSDSLFKKSLKYKTNLFKKSIFFFFTFFLFLIENEFMESWENRHRMVHETN